MKKYRIYALIHGQTLRKGKIFGCEIKKMTFEEQSKRKFWPIQSVFSENEVTSAYKTYVTFLPYVDPVRIKSEYVIICDIDEIKPDAALGGAIKKIDRIARFLSLAQLQDVKKKFGENRGSFEPYVYQVNKIYLLNKTGAELKVDYKPKSGFVYLPDRPERKKWRDTGTTQFLKNVYSFHDETLERALKYLYRASIGHFLLDSEEKIALDHFKSIEIIVNSLGKKRIGKNKTTFKQKLRDVAVKLDITPEEKKRIESFYDYRSKYGDVAHPSRFDEVERYPNQFPIPSNTRYPGAPFDAVAPSILLKYYRYIEGVYVIDINDPSEVDAREGSFVKVYEITLLGTTHHNHWAFYTLEKNKHKLTGKLKTAFIKKFELEENQIAEIKILPKSKNALGEMRFRIRVCAEVQTQKI